MESSFSENRTCPGCNHVVKPTWKICPYCKHKLQENVSRANLRTAEDPRNSEYTVPTRNLPKEKRKGKGCIIAVVGVLVVLVIAAVVAKKCFLFDARDGQLYRIVKIGNQTWMAENLNYNAEGSKCYNNKSANCKEYGRLYTWNVAKSACPNGWHLPSGEEFETLLEMVGGDGEERSLNLRAPSWDGGLDKYVFSVLPADDYISYHEGGVDYLGSYAFFWSSTEIDDLEAYGLYVNESDAYVNDSDKTNGNRSPVRCLQD